MAEKITLTIDGKKITADSKKTVLEAATENSFYIPTMCYLKKLSPIGSCRLCLVEVEGADDPQAACQLPVMEGMVVTTKSDKLTELRQMMLRLLLVNHPLDCPVCERSGECKLQDKTFEFGITAQDFKAEPVERIKQNNWKLVKYNPNLCVLCGRCLSVCHEIQGVSAYRINDFGYKSVIDTVDGKPLDCDFCGQCLSVCPVGALSSGLLLQARSWELNKVRTICSYCGTGCSFNLDVKKDKIYRVTSDDNLGINNGNLCARGRFGYQYIDSPERIKTPLIKKGDKLSPVSWDEALTLISSRFKEIKQNSSGDAIAGLGSERASNEDNYLFQKFFRCVLGSHNIDNLLNLEYRAFGSDIFEKFDYPVINSTQLISKADIIFTFGADPGEENPVIGNMMRMAVRDNQTRLIAASSRDLGFKPAADCKLIYRYGTEILTINGIIKSVLSSSPSQACQGLDGFNEFSNYLQSVNLHDVAEKTGISEELIQSAARSLKKSASPVILCGREIYTHPQGPQIVLALQNLANVINGNIMLLREYSNSQGVNDMGVLPDKYPGYLKVTEKAARELFQQAWGCILPENNSLTSSQDIFSLANSEKLKALYVMGEDIIGRFGNTGYKEALKKIGFIVVQDMFLTETARLADLVLPAASFAEREGTFTNMEGRVQKFNKAIEPLGVSRPDWEIINALAAKMGAHFNYTSTEDIFKEICSLAPVYLGLTYAGIKQDGGLGRYLTSVKRKFKTLEPGAIEATGDADMPFVLLNGNTLFHLGVLSRKSAALNILAPDSFIEINPMDADMLNIKDQDKVIVKSVHGSVTVQSRVTAKSSRGVVFIPINFEDTPVDTLIKKKDAITKVKILKAS